MLEVLFLEPSVSTARTRAAVSPDRPDMWELVRRDVGNFGDDDFRRRRMTPNAEQNPIDDTHPATLLRLRLLETLPPANAQVVLDSARELAVGAELTGHLAVAAKHVADHIRYRR